MQDGAAFEVVIMNILYKMINIQNIYYLALQCNTLHVPLSLYARWWLHLRW